MILKIVSLFLVFMAILAMFGRLKVKRPTLTARCPKCNRIRLGKSPCPCQRPLSKD